MAKFDMAKIEKKKMHLSPGPRGLRRAGLALCIFASMPFFIQAATAQTVDMELGGKNWASTRVSASATSIGQAAALNINAFIDGPKIEHIAFLLFPSTSKTYVQRYDITAGIHAPGSNSGHFSPDMIGGNPLEDTLRFETGTVVIERYDEKTQTVTGTFSGTVKNRPGTKTFDIKNGRFTQVPVGS